jgi:hypothetical protein
MNDKNTQPHQRPITNTFGDSAKPIAVSIVQFRDQAFEIPGKLQSSAIRSEVSANRARWRITCLPVTRVLQLEWFAAGQKDPDALYMVPLEAVNWFVPIAG